MIKIVDRYILKRYLMTFFALLLMFIPIGIMIDLSEKIDRIMRSVATKDQIFLYYLGFAGYFADLLFPIFLFISIIWFTSKLANNTEIVAILSSGISFQRFLRPYLIGASIIGVFVFVMGMFVVPKASKVYQDFTHEYLYTDHKVMETSKIFNQINDNEYVYVSSFYPLEKRGTDFTLEHFEGNRMIFKIYAKQITWNEKNKMYHLEQYMRREISPSGDDTAVMEAKKDTILPFRIDDLSLVSYVAETKNVFELNSFIEKEKTRGSPNVNLYILVSYKRWAMPFTVLVLTLIAVSVSAIKRRGGMGLNLSFGMLVAFIYVFFDKIFGVLVSNSGFSPFLAVLIPNFIFGSLALFLLQRAKR